jgi:hypothetical protein
VLLAAAPAGAHQASVVYSRIVAAGHTVAYTFQIGDAELGPALGLGERPPTRDETRAKRAALLTYVGEHVRVTNGGAPCEPRPDALELTDKADGFFAVATVDYECRRTLFDVAIEYQLFFDLDPRHQSFATVEVFGAPPRDTVFRSGARDLRLSREPSLAEHMRDYLLLGVEHIFTGYDHIAFLFGLLLVVGFSSLRGALRRVLGVVTAFTVAHSVTLIASGLGLVRLSARVVEPAIALSIAYVAVENLITIKPRGRWLLTFGFGLVHGFGFASLLSEVGLPPRGQVLSLLSFNLGVELGQLAVVALAAPALYLFAQGPIRERGWLVLVGLQAVALVALRAFQLPWPQLIVVVVAAPQLLAQLAARVGYDRAVRVCGSATLGLLAAFWFFERILARSWLGGAFG